MARCVCVSVCLPADDGLRGFPPQGLLLQELFQHPGPAGGQRFSHLLRDPVSQLFPTAWLWGGMALAHCLTGERLFSWACWGVQGVFFSDDSLTFILKRGGSNGEMLHWWPGRGNLSKRANDNKKWVCLESWHLALFQGLCFTLSVQDSSVTYGSLLDLS